MQLIVAFHWDFKTVFEYIVSNSSSMSDTEVTEKKEYEVVECCFLDLNSSGGGAACKTTENIVPISSSISDTKDTEKKQFESGEFFADLNSSVGRAVDVKKLQMDFGMLLFSKEDCDVVIKVQGAEFSAHKVILRARSTVFKAMFSHEMIEKESGSVNIDDCDSITFHNLLCYIYTGHCIITEENVCSLYRASDKYDVKELKLASLKYMKEKLSVNVFCDVMSLALIYNEKKLITVATEFFCKYAQEIVETPKWFLFLDKNMIAGNELFIKALSAVNKELGLCKKMHFFSTKDVSTPCTPFKFSFN